MAVLINFITIHNLMLNMKMESAKLEIKRKGHTLPYNKSHWDYEKNRRKKALIYEALQRENPINQ